jgi:ABC-type glycerol-3-phosphate transport system substrate-binding protein
MQKLFVPLALASVLALTGCSAGNYTADSTADSATSTPTAAAATPTPTPVVMPDLVGEWKQNNSKSDGG